MIIPVKYFDEAYLNRISIGDWIDVKAVKVEVNGKVIYDKEIHYNPGDVVLIHLGFAMQLPKGCEGHLLPRSSTFKNYGLLLTNSMGVIDNSYCGDNDEWMMMYYAVKKGVINIGDRMGQFRIMEKQPNVNFLSVETLGNTDRGGYGSTGR